MKREETIKKVTDYLAQEAMNATYCLALRIASTIRSPDFTISYEGSKVIVKSEGKKDQVFQMPKQVPDFAYPTVQGFLEEMVRMVS